MRRVHLSAAVTAALHIWGELDDDYVELWKVPWYLRRELPGASDRVIWDLAEPVLLSLTRAGVAFGHLDGESGVLLPSSSEDPLAAAMAEWRSLGRDPTIGEIAWLSRT